MEKHQVNKPLQYRRGSLNDLRQVKQLALDSYSQYKEVLGPENWAKLDAFIHKEELFVQLLTKAAAFLCLDQTSIVGMAYLVPRGNPTHIYPADWCYIRMVGVDPSYSGRGIAKKLTQLCIGHARQSAEKIIGLHTSEIMDAARHIYENLGFIKLKEIDPIYGMRYWLYQLEIS